MSANKQQDSHRPPSDGGMAKEEFIRVGTTLYKIVEQPKLNGGYVRKRIAWNNETLRQDYGKDYIGSVPKYDGFCTVPEHIGYCLLYTSPSPRDRQKSRMPSSA